MWHGGIEVEAFFIWEINDTSNYAGEESRWALGCGEVDKVEKGSCARSVLAWWLNSTGLWTDWGDSMWHTDGRLMTLCSKLYCHSLALWLRFIFVNHLCQCMWSAYYFHVHVKICIRCFMSQALPEFRCNSIFLFTVLKLKFHFCLYKTLYLFSVMWKWGI